LTALLALQSAQNESLPIPAALISLAGCLDLSFSFGMDGPQSQWDIAVNPHDSVVHFKPSPALPELKRENAHPCLPRLELAMHPLASPILCPEEMFKSLPPMLMLMSNGEFFYREFSRSFGNLLI
jgi:acetyl esterase/lipase